MNARLPAQLHHQLQIIHDLIPGIQLAVLAGPVADLQQAIQALDAGVAADPAVQLRQPAIRLVAALADDVGVEEVGLLREQRRRVGPEGRGGQLEHAQRRLVRQGRRRVPGLHLVPEDDAQRGVGGLDVRADVGVEGVEELFGELGRVRGEKKREKGSREDIRDTRSRGRLRGCGGGCEGCPGGCGRRTWVRLPWLRLGGVDAG